jgi:hypothetical protein
MSKRFNEKRAKAEEFAFVKANSDNYGKEDFEDNAAKDSRGAAMGQGEAELFEKKMSKEEKKAAAKLARETKKKAKDELKGVDTDSKIKEVTADIDVLEIARSALDNSSADAAKREELLEKLSDDQIQVTYESKKGKLRKAFDFGNGNYYQLWQQIRVYWSQRIWEKYHHESYCCPGYSDS